MADKDSSGEKTISWEEVKEHNSKKNNVWVAINNKVYDVTEFMDEVSVWCHRFNGSLLLSSTLIRQCAFLVLHVASGWRGGTSRASGYGLCTMLERVLS